jgi:pyrroline-5-carboxylate reductase
MRIAILGVGKIGESLLAGLRSSGWPDIVATARREERAAELREQHGVEATTANGAAVIARYRATFVTLSARAAAKNSVLARATATAASTAYVIMVA